MKRLVRHPIRAIREPFGTAGLIVACIALVAALGGTALAAAKLNSKQKKEVEKIAKKFAGKPGTNGATGPAGPTGPAGANGKDGANGTNGTAGTPGSPGAAGKSVTVSHVNSPGCEGQAGAEVKVEGAASGTKVCNGQTGFTSTLPSHKTEQGTWSVDFEATGAAQTETSPISFPIPLSTPVAAHFNENETTECPGTTEAPEAEPGNLCVYTSAYENAELWKPLPALPEFNTNFINPEAFGANTETGRAGAVVIQQSVAAGKVFALGTWAVTAP